MSRENRLKSTELQLPPSELLRTQRHWLIDLLQFSYNIQKKLAHFRDAKI